MIFDERSRQQSLNINHGFEYDKPLCHVTMQQTPKGFHKSVIYEHAERTSTDSIPSSDVRPKIRRANGEEMELISNPIK